MSKFNARLPFILAAITALVLLPVAAQTVGATPQGTGEVSSGVAQAIAQVLGSTGIVGFLGWLHRETLKDSRNERDQMRAQQAESNKALAASMEKLADAINRQAGSLMEIGEKLEGHERLSKILESLKPLQAN